MKLIVGLGNPGVAYSRTRHNVGFHVVDALASRFRIAFDRHEKEAFTGRGRIAGRQVLLAKPQTFMNLSGNAVGGLFRANLSGASELLVIYDDIDLPLGKIRVRENGSAGTHNGMKSVVEALGSETFPRLRFGVRGEDYEPGGLRDYVLEDFKPDEESLVGEAVDRALDAVLLYIRDDLRRAMNEFNRDPVKEIQPAS